VWFQRKFIEQFFFVNQSHHWHSGGQAGKRAIVVALSATEPSAVFGGRQGWNDDGINMKWL
jgi:hypothetical protein